MLCCCFAGPCAPPPASRVANQSLTRRGPIRRGWTISTIHTILMNDNYRGRWVWNKTYRYGRYRCSFNVAKGPAICPNSISIRQEVLDAKLLDKFRAALIPDMIEYLAGVTNQVLQELHGATPREISTLAAEREVVERQLTNLVQFVANGDLSSARMRDEIRAREQRLIEMDRQLDKLRSAEPPHPC